MTHPWAQWTWEGRLTPAQQSPLAHPTADGQLVSHPLDVSIGGQVQVHHVLPVAGDRHQVSWVVLVNPPLTNSTGGPVLYGDRVRYHNTLTAIPKFLHKDSSPVSAHSDPLYLQLEREALAHLFWKCASFSSVTLTRIIPVASWCLSQDFLI